MSRSLTKTAPFKVRLLLEHVKNRIFLNTSKTEGFLSPKNERLPQTTAFKPKWRSVFLIIMNFDKEKLESLRKEKAERRGGFKEKIILDAVEER
jgi:hypothetical protein